MSNLAGFPFTELHFKSDGFLGSKSGCLATAGTTDLIVIAHGWKNDGDDARKLYESILSNIRRAAGGNLTEGGRNWAAIGVFWPAFRFEEDLSLLPIDGTAALGGGAAGIESNRLDRNVLRAFAARFANAIGTEDAEGFVTSAMDATEGGVAADQFLNRLQGLLDRNANDSLQDEHSEMFEGRGRDLFDVLKSGGNIEVAETTLDAQQAVNEPAASLGGTMRRFQTLRSGGAAAIARLLNQATYYTMKDRAGIVGRGLARELSNVHSAALRLHLVGHSFGGRLVTAAAADEVCPRLTSLSLLQAAYSHNGLGTGFGESKRSVGAFRAVVERKSVEGPILITHTLNDRAVGLAYPLASAISGTIASGLQTKVLIGGPNDPHGGMGANGAQFMKDGEAIALNATPGLTLQRGIVNNVLSDTIVADHNDVANEAVGALVWAAIAAS